MIKILDVNKTVLGMLTACIFLAGCDTRQAKVQAAVDEYQAAIASKDFRSAYNALNELVRADDSNAGYWIELGKVALQLDEYGVAYNAFLRAKELDRANAEVLNIITQLALRSGNLEEAESTARELELIAPDDPAIALTFGYVALRRGDFDQANKEVERILTATPYDSSGNILRARVLMAEKKTDSAIKLLKEQTRLVPSDQASLSALAAIYEMQEQWADAAEVGGRLLAWRQHDPLVRAQQIEFLLRSGDVTAAQSATVAGLRSATALQLEKLLAPWIATGKEAAIADSAFSEGIKADGERRLAIARFLAQAGDPARVVVLTKSLGQKTLTVRNTSWAALYAAALGSLGDTAEGFRRLNRAVDLDAANADALRGRAELRNRVKDYRRAIEDGQALVAADPDSAQARLLLFRLYVDSGDNQNALRTLWNAFHEIEGDRTLYETLVRVVAASEGQESAQRIAKEFYDQRYQKMIRGFA